MFSKGNSKDWRLWLQLFKRRWYVILGCTLLGIGAGLYLAFTIEPEFESQSRIIIVNTDLLSGSRLQMPSSPIREEIDYFRRRLTSIDFLRLLNDSLNLKQDPKIMTEIKELSLTHPDIPRADIVQHVCLQHLNKRITSRMQTYNIVEIKTRGRTSQGAYKLCKMITDLSISESQKSQIQSASFASSFSHELLDTYKNRLAVAEAQLKKFDTEQIKDSQQEFGLSSEKFQEIQTTILSADIDIQVKTDKFNELNSMLNNVPQMYRIQLERSLADLKKKMFHRTENVCQLFKRFTWQDVEITLLNDEIARLKKNTNDRIQDYVSDNFSGQSQYTIEKIIELESLRLEIELRKHQRDIFTKIVQEYKDINKPQPSLEAARVQLEQEVAVTRETYDMLLKQVRGTQIRETAQHQEAQLKFRLLTPPIRPLDRIKPSRKRILMIALCLGLAAGVGLVWGMENTNNTITDVDQVTEYMKVPVIATIPRMAPSRQKPKRKQIGRNHSVSGKVTSSKVRA